MGASNYKKRKEDKEFLLYETCKKYLFQELIESLHSNDSDVRYAAARELQTRNDGNTLEVTLRLIESPNYKLRAISTFILGQLKLSSGDDEAVTLLLCALAVKDKSAVVRCGAVAALGHICTNTPIYNRTVIQLLKITTYDKSPSVRHSTAFALSSIDMPETEGLLLKLIKDSDSDVIDWGLFSMNCRGYDSQEIRDILFAYLSNEHEGIKMEAIHGLTQRKDERVIPFLRDAIKAGEIYAYTVDAVTALGDQSLLELL